MSLIIAKNKVNAEQLRAIKTPEASESFTPIPHFRLVEMTKEAIDRAGFQITQEEHALARGGLRYFGGLALSGSDITSSDRKMVLGIRNSGDKSFAASVCLGSSMIVCENLHFSSDIKLARRHTSNIMSDLPRVLADAVGRVVSQWHSVERRLEAYKQIEVTKKQAADLLIDLVDAKALPAREIYNTIQEFRAPHHPEFKDPTLFSLFNAFTQQMKGSDLAKLPYRSMVCESIFDRVASFHADEKRLSTSDLLPA